MIYLFDKQQNIIGLLKESDLTAGQIDFKINTAIEFSFSVPINKGFNDDVKYVSTPHPKESNKHLIFRLMSRNDNVDSIEYTASELAYQELASSAYIEDKRPKNVSASQAMTYALAGSQWSLGTVNIGGSVTTNFYYITNLEAIQKVVGLMGGEVYFYITITGNKISGRFMDYVFRQGNDTSKVFADGSNLLTVTKKQQSDSIYTAILPRGKGEQVSSGSDGSPDGYGRRIDISGVTWSKSSGKQLDKPAGSKILEDHDATAKYGHINGSARLYLTTFDEIEDPNVLIQQAYQTLMSINHPLVEYSATVAKVGNLSLGDTVLIMHSDRDLSYKTRVFEVKYDLLNPEMTELSLGDNLSSNSITSQINQLSGSITTNSNQVQWSVANGGHNNTSFGAEEPPNPKKGDVWFKALPNGNTEEYYFDGTIWVLGAKTDQQWQENRAVAQGDNTVYYGNADPVGAVLGDVWFKTDNNEPDGKAMYTYSGTVWVKFKGAYDASRLQAGTVDAYKVNVLNLSADNIVTGELSANFIKGGQLDFSQINGININASNITTGNLTGVQIGITNGGKFYANQLGTIYDFSDNPYYYNNQPSGNTDPWIRINQNGVYNLGSDGTRLAISGTVTAADAYIGSAKQYAWYTQSDAGIQSGTNRLNVSAELGMTGLRISQEDADHPEQTGGYSFLTGHGMYVGYNQNNPRFSVNTSGTVYADTIKLIGGRGWQSINSATTDLAKLQQGQDLQFYVGSSNTMNLYSNNGNVSLKASGRWLVEARNNGYIYLGNVKWTSGGTSVQMATDGALTALSSSIKYKTNIEYDKDGSAGEKLLTLDPMTWQDKSDDEEIQRYKESGIKPDHKIDLSNRRYYGMLAEDFDKAGLDDFVLKDEETGELHGIQYEKIGAALIPIIRNMRKMILEQQVEIERLKEK